MPNTIFLFFSSFILSLFSLIILRKISFKFNLIKPIKKVPFTGGMGFSLAFIISYLFYSFINKMTLPFELIWLLIFSFIVLGIEFVDDLRDFSLRARVIIQFIIIFLFLLFGKRIQIHFLPNWLNYILSFLWIMGIINAFNLLDIGDGLCAGVSLIICLGFFLISVTRVNFLLITLFIALLGVVSCFFLFNLPPAKVFMGNSGSHFLGFIFATLSMYTDYATLENPLAIITPLLILAFPIIDTVYLMFIRLNKKIIPLRKSNDHIFLRLILGGYSHKKVLNIIYFLVILWCLGGVSLTYGFNHLFLVFVIAAFLASFFVIFKANQVKMT